MFKNFLKVTLRSLLKSKLFVFINIIGLGLSLACGIVAYLNYDFAMSFDDNHENKDEIYQVSIKRQLQGNEVPYCFSPLALGPNIAREVAGLKGVTRYHTGGATVKMGDKIFNRNIGYGDEAFLDIFTYPLKYGSKENFLIRSNIMLSSETAIAFFGGKNPVGETVEIINNDGPNWFFTVGGVFEPIPENTIMQFQALTLFENYHTLYKVPKNDWRYFASAIFVQTEDPAAAYGIPSMIQKYVAVQNEARKDWLISGFWVQTLEDAPFNQRDLNGSWLWQAMHPAAIMAPNVMAILILLLACFNFTNTSIAISNKRMKEIGLRKVVGGSRRQLIFQFLGENLLLCLLSLLVGLLIAVWLVPHYSDMWPGMTLELNLGQDIGLVLFLVLVLIVTAFLAGGYPALYVSKFRPVAILRGTLKVGGSSILSRILLALQFMISVLSLISGFAFLQNANFQKTLDQGYDKEMLVVVPLNNAQEVSTFKNTIATNPDILSVSATQGHIGWSYFSRSVKSEDTEIQVDIMDVGLGYDATVGLEILEGRGFDAQNQETDKVGSVVVNQKMARSFGWDNPVGRQVTLFDTLRYTVVGVVKDFYVDGLWNPIEPLMMRLRDEKQVANIVARVSNGRLGAVNDYLEGKWVELFPERPYRGFLHEQRVLGEASDVNNNIVKIFLFLSFIAVVLSAIGLFTLVSLNIISRTKEIGVRKVLGASIPNLTTLINRPFLIIVTIASIIGAVASTFATDGLMDSIWTYHMEMNVLSYVVPIVFILLISFVSISGKVLKAARRNPVESLRYE